MVIFFIGIGASALLAGLANSPVQLALCLTLVGVFAAIYHPVGLAMVVQGRDKTGVALAINGVFWNMGVASAPLLWGFLIDASGWRSAFFIPGVVSMVIGGLYLWFVRMDRVAAAADLATATASQQKTAPPVARNRLERVFGIIFFTTAIGGLIFPRHHIFPAQDFRRTANRLRRHRDPGGLVSVRGVLGSGFGAACRGVSS